eukprot:gnl/MRDRNA2_/MRDRNA2_120617_c0_seq1.p1 gnl/MRDRNA2_/MRDRNA2_120617_c0~~gnl/MRDRNA2_/MRDRNA2_120617_c0_seq1.p1  ORF type:complete len:234 (+),score=49.89 gnl/MRDRNA2_/MRDRNA2_120617_c0_seq1:139-840(+)
MKLLVSLLLLVPKLATAHFRKQQHASNSIGVNGVSSKPLVSEECQKCLAAHKLKMEKVDPHDSNFTKDDRPDQPCGPDCVPMDGDGLHPNGETATGDWGNEYGEEVYDSSGQGISEHNYNYTHNGTNVGAAPSSTDGTNCTQAGANKQSAKIGDKVDDFELKGINMQCSNLQKARAYRDLTEEQCRQKCAAVADCTFIVVYTDGRTTSCEMVIKKECKMSQSGQKNRVWQKMK